MVAPENAGWARARMVDALRLLALPAGEQLTALPSFVEVPDELALAFDEAYRLTTGDEPAWTPNPEQLHALRDIDTVLEEMSRPPAGLLAWTPESLAVSAWTVEALHTDHRWALVRSRAQRALRLLGARPGRPDPHGVIYAGEGDARPESDR